MVAAMKRPLPSLDSNPAADYHSADFEHVHKRQHTMGLAEEFGAPTPSLPAGFAGFAQNPCSAEDLPMNVAMVLQQASSVTSMDFHPSHPSMLLVGTHTGDISIWEVSSKERLAHTKFKVWNLAELSIGFKARMAKDSAMSVNRVLWHPDGNRFGVAYSKHLVHLYSYNGHNDFSNHLEIDAHTGGVNDIAFVCVKNVPYVISCGDDRNIRVWDTKLGVVQHTFIGHKEPVHSIYPHSKNTTQYLLSTSLDGKIKGWVYEKESAVMDNKAPGIWCASMAYSSDGTRLFSCGISEDGKAYIVEWNDKEGSVIRTYAGFQRKATCVVQFDNTKNQFLAAGDGFMVKFWHMDNNKLLATTDAGGELPASPRIRFNKSGSLLAVSTRNNSIKILANSDGFKMLRELESQPYNASRSTSEEITKASTFNKLCTISATSGTTATIVVLDSPVSPTVGLLNGDNLKPTIIEETNETTKSWKVAEISEPSQCWSLKLSDKLLEVEVARMTYTNSGTGILALASNAIHKLWKWEKTDRNVTGKATAMFEPQLWKPKNGMVMVNEIDADQAEAVHCFALSNNGSYLLSSSGGQISLYNLMAFKRMTAFMGKPTQTTFLAFHPKDNNVIAIGTADSLIQVYNIQTDEISIRLIGHKKRITGLVFSKSLNILLSSGADAQLCVWGMDGWVKQASTFLQITSGRVAGSNEDTRVQFHNDQIHFLAVHESQIAIYEASKLECLKQWTPREGSVTNATYSCDSQLIYASFTSGCVGVFTSELVLRCRISPLAYLSCHASPNVYPVVVAAHPSEPDQFALGLNQGTVHVLEPLDSWGTDPPTENATLTQPSANPSSDQPSR